jgi:nucleotide-binding universal stress UspA family protein
MESNLMKNIKKILLAVDLSDSMAPAVAQAISLGKFCGAEIIPFHALENINRSDSVGIDPEKQLIDQISPKMEDLVANLTSDDITVNHSFIQDANPILAVISIADRLDVDLILLGGRVNSPGTNLLSTMTEKIVMSANQPVLVVHPQKSTAKIEQVLCALDCNPASDDMLETTISLCQSLNSKLSVTNIFQENGDFPRLKEFTTRKVDLHADTETDFVRDGQGESNESGSEINSFKFFLSKLDCSGVDYRYMTLQGNPSEKVFELIRGTNCDLLVIGVAPNQQNTTFFVRGTLGTVLRDLPCSLMTVKHEDTMEEGVETVVM